MYISRFQVRNYKSFSESGLIELGIGFNIVTGQNNSGKTALLQALSFSFPPNPHLSVKSKPRADAPVNPMLTIDFSFVAEPDEIKSLLATPGTYFLPHPRYGSDFMQVIEWPPGNEGPATNLVNWVLARSTSLTFNLRYAYQPGGGQSWHVTQVPSFGGYECEATQPGANRRFVSHNVYRDGRTLDSHTNQPDDQEVGVTFAQILVSRIYRFNAERFTLGSCPRGNNPNLAPDASNLAAVLAILNGNPERFARLNRLVQQLFPGIRAITVKPDKSDPEKQTLFVWNIDPVSEREDLAIPLSDSGTGLGQVLAILYVVLTADTPRVFIIDEPQSFLHPGAVRKLMEILKSYSDKHQFIVATHSPTVITAAMSPRVFHVSIVEGESQIKVLQTNQTSHLQELLAELGATLGDVFGADNILWVEGPTEEVCFPKILSALGRTQKSLMGTVIKGVITTSDLVGKKRGELIWQIYQQLSNATGLIPSALGFLFDDEGRSAQEKKELRHMSGGLMTFTERRMYENYLLDPEAIAAVMNNIEGFREPPVTPSEVQIWFETHNRKRGSSQAENPNGPWAHSVDAYKLLKGLFNELSEARVVYDKTRHSIALTDWLLEHRPDLLQGIAHELETVLDEGEKRLRLSRVKSTV